MPGHPGSTPAVVDAAIGPPQPGSTRATDAARPSLCPPPRGVLDRARLVLQDRYALGSFPAVRLPHDLTWREDPFHDPNWVFRLHGLEPIQDLIAATASTGDTRFIARAIALARDWAGDNVTARPPSPYSWNDHSTAMRAIRLACLADARPSLVAVRADGSTPWLRRLLVRHGAKLADPGFYVRVGNHALNQSIGLLEVGRVVGRADWRRLPPDGSRTSPRSASTVRASRTSRRSATRRTTGAATRSPSGACGWPASPRRPRSSGLP